MSNDDILFMVVVQLCWSIVPANIQKYWLELYDIYTRK